MAVYYNGIETGTMYLGSNELAKKYLGNTEVAPGIIPWNPSLMPTFQSWWRADNGVTVDANNNVTSWQPVTASVGLSNATLVVRSGGTSPKYVTQVAGMNNQAGIEFGTVSTSENLATSAAVGNVFTPGLGCFHWYVISTTTNANGGDQWVGGPIGESGGGGYISLLGTNYTSFPNAFVIYAPENSGGSLPAQTNLQPISSYPKALIGSFQQTAPLGGYSEGGYYLNNAVASNNNLWNTTQGYPGPISGRACMYMVGNSGGLNTPFYGTILECGITGKDGPNAWSLLQEYVQERYNLTF